MRTFKKIALGMVIVCSLSACATAMLSESSMGKGKYVQKSLLEDQLIAIGKPKQAITLAGYQDALVMVGEKQSYLVGYRGQTTGFFDQVMGTLDLRHVTISGERPDGFGTVLQASASSNVSSSRLTEIITMGYRKPLAHVSVKERSQLNKMNFNCDDTKVKGELLCQTRFKVQYQPIAQVGNVDQLQHTFREKYRFSVVQDNWQPGSSAGKVLLYPLTIAIDVVTSPIQLIGLAMFASAYSKAGI